MIKKIINILREKKYNKLYDKRFTHLTEKEKNIL